ncbi:DUF7285 family protein [Halobellus sp. EA9]|uniref:DUF7285 family protein n=1 Tax=Halobellus sp. EA9 TaxID=3421647 RepID=UPI003EBDAE43
MSSSSTREAGADARAQTTPIVALIALFAVCSGVSLYASALTAATPSETTNALAEPTLDRVHDAVSTGGVVDPFALPRAADVAPDGYRVAVEVTTDRGRFGAGGPPPREGVDVDRASRPASVDIGTGDVAWGRLTVWVWR